MGVFQRTAKERMTRHMVRDYAIFLWGLRYHIVTVFFINVLTVPKSSSFFADNHYHKNEDNKIHFSKLLKNIHLPLCAHFSSLRRTVKYASFLMISRALHLNVFDQPVKKHFSTTC